MRVGWGFLCLTLILASGQADALRPPAAWLKLDAGPFSILAPSGWEFHQLTGVDSYVGEFVGDGVTLTFDFGRYASSLKQAKEPAYVIVKKSIGGYRAKVVSPRTPGHGITGVYFRKVNSGGDELCLWGKNLSAVQQELVLKVLETIRFGGVAPQYVVPPPPPGKTHNVLHMPARITEHVSNFRVYQG